MVRTLIVGDVHDKWASMTKMLDEIIISERIEKIIFLGDLTNDWNQTADTELDEIKTMADWIAYKRESGLEVTVLIGNHDVYYLIDGHDHSAMADLVNRASPGHNMRNRMEVGSLIRSVEPEVMTTVDSCGKTFLLSHAGLTNAWSETVGLHDGSPVEMARQVNIMMGKRDWKHLYMIGVGRGGWMEPSPLWADMTELVEDHLTGLNQIVGHTPVRTITKTTGDSELLFCDTFSTNPDGSAIGDSSMLYTDGSTFKKIRQYKKNAIISEAI